MTDAAETRRSHRAAESGGKKPHRHRFYTRWWFWLIIVIILVILACAAWVGSRALKAKDDLEAAMPMAKSLKAQVLAQNIPAAQETLEKLEQKVDDAKKQTHDPLWRVAEYVPVLGSNFTAVRQLAETTDSVVTKAVTPLMGVAKALNPETFKPVNGAINPAPLVKAIPAIDQANTAVHAALAQLHQIDTSSTLGQIADAKAKLAGLLGGLEPTLSTLHTVVPLLPAALGVDAPRTYIVVFQNLAEARSLGGTGLSTAKITVNKGAITLDQVVPGSHIPAYSHSVIPVPDGVEAIYRDSFGTSVANSTVRPSFISAATTVRTIWQQVYGGPVDGVISVDPVALGYLMEAVGPTQLPTGDVLTSKNVTSLLLNEVYQRYPRDNDAQDAVYAAAVSAVFSKLSAGELKPKVLLSGLVKAWGERRILFWSAHPKEQAQLAKAGLNGELPKSDASTARVGVYFQDDIGSKLDYYLKQKVQLSQAECRADGKANYRVAATLTNTEPENAAEVLSPSILGTWKREHLKPGMQRMTVMLYAPPGSKIAGMSVGGDPVKLVPYHDTDYPVAKVQIKFAPQESKTVTFDVVAAKPGKKKLEAQVTPGVHPTTIETKPLDCASVAGN